MVESFRRKCNDKRAMILKSDAVVIGAGVFGTWTALFLQEQGVRTLLIDAWGVAHPQATSADENRVTRASYGAQTLYTDWAWEALKEWKRREGEWKFQLFVPCGVLWLGRANDEHLKASLEALRARHIPFRELSLEEVSKEFPQFSTDGTEKVYLETAAGALLARKGCQRVAKAFQEAGGRLEIGQALPPATDSKSIGNKKDKLSVVRLTNGDEIQAEFFVFSAGPWLPQLFPDILKNAIRVSRQEVFYFGTPPGEGLFHAARMPVWIDFTEEPFYGLPAMDGRGVKAASDLTGPPFDPSRGDRVYTPAELQKVRAHIAKRLPRLKDSPLVESRVCQYERTSDSNLIVDRHPQLKNVVLAGGGSGHGFKLGPAVGRLAASLISNGTAEPPPEVQLASALNSKRTPWAAL